MIYLIYGASHTGKTRLAQHLLETYRYPYLSIDHLKMGLIRSGHTQLTPCSADDELTAYLWPIVREMIKTAIENQQHLIVEGCYIPMDWEKDFPPSYHCHIRAIGLVMSDSYIRSHFDDILQHANDIEQRLEDDCTLEQVLVDNQAYQRSADQHHQPYILIETDYQADIDRQLPSFLS